MALNITIQVRDNEVKGHSHGNSNWLSLTQWSGTWEAQSREIEANISMHFHTQADVRHVIAELEKMLTAWVDTSSEKEPMYA